MKKTRVVENGNDIDKEAGAIPVVLLVVLNQDTLEQLMHQNQDQGANYDD
jgi:hypothetical protein